MEAGEFSPAPEGAYYPHELAGLKVVRRGGEELGLVERLIETAGPDLLEVKAGSKSLLIPFVEAICRVDRSHGLIEIDPPEGLLELQ